MPPEESQSPRDWLRVAEKDWKRMGQALDDGDAEEAGFWLQQAVEKYLEAYLTERYPFVDSPELTLEEVSGSPDEVMGLVESIRRELE